MTRLFNHFYAQSAVTVCVILTTVWFLTSQSFSEIKPFIRPIPSSQCVRPAISRIRGLMERQPIQLAIRQDMDGLALFNGKITTGGKYRTRRTKHRI
jgi:hypothetical protein